MKLQTKATRYYLLFILPVLLAGAIALYIMISGEVKDSVDEALWKEKVKIEEQFGREDTITDAGMRLEHELDVSKLTGRITPHYAFSDTMLYDNYEEEIIPFRVLAFTLQGKQIAYKVTVRRSTVEADDLVESIAIVIVPLFGLLLIGFIALNYLITRKLWKPFGKTLDMLRGYHPGNEQVIEPEPTGIDEFTRLNEVLTEMSSKISSDYRNLKEFTENASHEIQTPLAVIRSKLELLLQDSDQPKEKLELIASCYDATVKLSKLNQALLLLTKMESSEFRKSEAVRLDKVIAKQLEHLGEFIEERKLQLVQDISPVTIQCHHLLADILISNLISNAIRHNIVNGELIIRLDNSKLVIENTGNALHHAPEQLFERFKKNDPASESLGLGLSITKKIVEIHGMKIEYITRGQRHIFTILF